MALRVALLFLLLATPAVYAATHVVGGSNGWNTGVDYGTWAKGQTFIVGDTLVFNYGSSHGVDVVSQDDYNNCNTGNSLQSFSGGSTSFPLNQTGTTYFTCPTVFHCGQGMKLAVNVQAAGGSPSGSPPTSSTPTTPSVTPSTPATTPSTSSPTSKSPPNESNRATGSFGSINNFMLGVSLVLAALFIRV